MAKYFYVYNIAGVEDSVVKMFNTDTRKKLHLELHGK